MIVWISLAVLAQFLAALTVFIDKFVLVSKTGIQHAAAFTFYTMMLSGLVLVMIPFGFVNTPSIEVAFFSLISALLYMTALLFLYRVLQRISVIEVIPLTAAAGAITTGILATFFLAQDLPQNFLPAFFLLILGTAFIYCFCFSFRLFFMALASGALLGSSTFAVKLVFEATTFGNALFWPLIMNVVVALVILAPARFFAIKDGMQKSSSGTKWLVLISKALGGLAFFLTFVAIAIGSVSIVSALGGLQLVFLFILVPLFMRNVDAFKDELRSDEIVLKAAGTVTIALGLATLFVV